MPYRTPIVIVACSFLVTSGPAADKPPLLSTAPTSAANTSPTPPKKEEEETVLLSPFVVNASANVGYFGGSTLSGTRLGATPGGLQDVNHGRELLAWGLLPHAEEITAEGLFSAYDLPTPAAGRSRQLLAITGDAKAVSILDRPEVTHLAQIGFSSGLDARTWRRDPVLVVAVADVSGSMDESLPLLKQSLAVMLGQLRPDDWFALVAFSDRASRHLAPTPATAASLATMIGAIERLEIGGGTNIEAGLALGFDAARTPLAGFSGRRRLVLITDAMPNIGATGATSFMAQAESASLAGVGLTTIGVGLDFSADFVKRVSSVSGGNAFYFAHAKQMEERLAKDFDFMVTELAFDVQIRVDPAPGCRLVEVYGLPGDAYARTPEGGMIMDLPTLFLSRERGAIFLAFAGVAQPGATLGHAQLSYTLHRAPAPEHSAFDLIVRSEQQAGVGLARGELLINEVAALRAASAAFYDEGDVAAAHAHAAAVLGLFQRDADRELRKELATLENVVAFLEVAAEPLELTAQALRAKPDASPLLGVWRFAPAEGGAPARFLVLLPAGRAALLDEPEDGARSVMQWRGRRLAADRRAAGTLAVNETGLLYRTVSREAGAAAWQLERCDPRGWWR